MRGPLCRTSPGVLYKVRTGSTNRWCFPPLFTSRATAKLESSVRYGRGCQALCHLSIRKTCKLLCQRPRHSHADTMDSGVPKRKHRASSFYSWFWSIPSQLVGPAICACRYTWLAAPADRRVRLLRGRCGLTCAYCRFMERCCIQACALAAGRCPFARARWAGHLPRARPTGAHRAYLPCALQSVWLLLIDSPE
jgi:hypothetical protein